MRGRVVIASAARQSRGVRWLHTSGLPRPCAPRSDEIGGSALLDCRVAALLAVTGVGGTWVVIANGVK